MTYDWNTFRLEINSFEEFAAFVALIRGEDFDLTKLQELTARLKKSNQDLAADVKAAEKGLTP